MERADGPGALLSFDRFELDTHRARLRRSGRAVRVPPQSMTILLILVRRAGETVTRNELHCALWPAGTHVEFDAGLNTAMRRLRRALGDTAAQPRFIQTVPGCGYRFVHPMARIATPVPVARPVTPPPATTVPRRTFRLARLLGAAAVVALTVLEPAIAPVAQGADVTRNLIERACALKNVGRPDLALAVIDGGLARAPRSAPLLAHRGLYLHAVGRYDEEIPVLREAIAMDPLSAEAHFHLGLGYARRRQYPESLAALQTAVALSDGAPQFLSWLGRIAAEAGRRREAEDALHALQRRAASSPVPASLIDSVAYYLAVTRS